MYKNKISAVYKIVNTTTGDCYVGSSRNVMKRWSDHTCQSTWNNFPNNRMYQDMQKYGVDKFRFQILAPVMPEYLKQVEQEFIDLIQPTYNVRKSKLRGVSYFKPKNDEHTRELWRRTSKTYYEKHHEEIYNKNKNIFNMPCLFNGEIIKLNTLRQRFRRDGIKNAFGEAKKYLIKEEY